jgi:radical SAM-linked protein
MMRLAFDNPLPVGMESEKEGLTAFFDRALAPKTIVKQLNAHLPTGLMITGCRLFQKGGRDTKDMISAYRIGYPEGMISQSAIDRFMDRTEFIVEDTGKKGKKRQTDLRKAVQQMTLTDDAVLEMTLRPLDTRTVRPFEVLKNALGFDDEALSDFRVRKLK